MCNILIFLVILDLPFLRCLACKFRIVWKSNCKQMNPKTKNAKYKLEYFLEKYFIFSSLMRYSDFWRTCDEWQNQILKHLILELKCSCSTFFPFSHLIWDEFICFKLWLSIKNYRGGSSKALKYLCRFWLIHETENFISNKIRRVCKKQKTSSQFPCIMHKLS